MPPQEHLDPAPLWAWLAKEQRSVRWLARKTGRSEGTIRAVKMGRRPATRAFAERIAAALDLPVDDLFAPLVDTEGSDAESKGNTR